jgi:hypothetical protein
MSQWTSALLVFVIALVWAVAAFADVGPAELAGMDVDGCFLPSSMPAGESIALLRELPPQGTWTGPAWIEDLGAWIARLSVSPAFAAWEQAACMP